MNRIHPTGIGARANNVAMIRRRAINECLAATVDAAAFNGAIKSRRTHDLCLLTRAGTALAKASARAVGHPTIDRRTRAHGRWSQTAFARAIFIAKFSRYVASIRQIRRGFAIRKHSGAALRALAATPRTLSYLQIRSARRTEGKNG